MSQYRLAAVGAFVIGGLLLFAVGLFMIADRRLMFAEQFELNVEFGRVTGLQVGTRVRTAGLDAGEVLEIVVPSSPSERFVVRMRVQERLRPLVRADSTCSIQTDGLVGAAFIQISRGSDEAPPVEPGGTIVGNDPIAIVDLIEEGRTTFQTVTAEIVDLKGEVSETFQALTETTRAANEIMTEAGDEFRQITRKGVAVADDMQAVLADTRAVFARVRAGEGTIGRLVAEDELYQRAQVMAAEVEAAMRNLREVTERARDAVTTFTGDDGGGPAVMSDVRITLAHAQEVMSDLSEVTEAVKRSWPMSGFFEERGFFDLDSLTPAEYRRGALQASGRTPLRVWLEADVLFRREPSGLERLTEDGRRRIDAAMADLLRFPRESPLVVEGYVPQGTDEPQLRSEDRALAVREYLLDRFRREVTLTGTMPLGSEAEGSPSGDGRWSGVALAMFVSPDAMGESR